MKKKIANTTTKKRTKKRKNSSEGTRLQKILADAGLFSRRKAEEAIKEGRIAVNGETVTEPGAKADPSSDSITCDGRQVKAVSKTYIILNKPAGVLCTTYDPEGRPTVLDITKEIKQKVSPVGRLDYNTTGLLILTNDGAFAQKMMRPSSKIIKKYHAKVRGTVSEKTLSRMRYGITLEGIKYRFADVKLVRTSGNNSFLTIDLTEGKKHHIRIVCETLGNPVVKLSRVAFGPIKLSNLPLGAYRHLSEKEVKALKNAAS